MKIPTILLLIASSLLRSEVRAGETPETVLIRRALENDRSGRRRGDAGLVLSAFADRVVIYQGHHNADPRAWTVRRADRAAFAAALEADLERTRYDIERVVPSIQVRAGRATATTLDSGQVIDRRSGEARPLKVQRFWTFLKKENKWLATALVEDPGDTLLPPSRGSDKSDKEDDLAAFFQREKTAWEEGDAGTLAALCDEDFVGYDAAGHFKAAQWVILFSGAEEWEKWLEKRLSLAHYTLERQLIHTRLGPTGRQALALTRERVSTTYESGPATHTLERYVLWLLSRRSGTWKLTQIFYDYGLAP